MASALSPKQIRQLSGPCCINARSGS
jgi:hypothetical protein